jgi:hypothetical protein
MTRTKIALAAVLLIGTATAALAEDGFRAKSTKRYSASAVSSAIQSTPKRLNQGVDVSMPGSNLMMNVMDRASSPFACGG